MKQHYLFLLLFFTFPYKAYCQENSVLGINNPSNPTLTRTQFSFDFDSYFFVAENRLLAARPAFHYDFNSNRHKVMMEVPILSTFYSGNYQGFERQTGLGDMRFKYMYLAYYDENARQSFNGLGITFEMITPTGNSQFGLGLGKWQYAPGVVFSFRPNPFFAFYPEIVYRFTADDVNGISLPGAGLPDFETPENDPKFQSILFEVPAVVELSDWNGWFSVSPVYLKDFPSGYSIFAFSGEIGLKTSENFGASIHILRFVAGQPRLITHVTAKFDFYLL